MTDVPELKPYQAFSHLRHGHAKRTGGSKASPTYQSWAAMKQRCNNAARDIEGKYVGRGIQYDPRWGSFDVFLADMGERPAGRTLDREDNNGPYRPGNCRWATPAQQARNRRTTRLTFETAVQVAIRRLRGEPGRSIAAAYGTSENLPNEIVKGRTWPDALAEAKRVIGAAK